MKPSEESITLITAYRLPHHRSRFFAGALNDALPLVPLLSVNKKTVRIPTASSVPGHSERR